MLVSLRKIAADAYLQRMFKAFEFCLPTKATKVPAGPEWFHEIKQDGFRIRVERDGDRVRLIMRGGYDWTKRYPRIVEAAATLEPILDGLPTGPLARLPFVANRAGRTRACRDRAFVPYLGSRTPAIDYAPAGNRRVAPRTAAVCCGSRDEAGAAGVSSF